jgi:hypothetical protein
MDRSIPPEAHLRRAQQSLRCRTIGAIEIFARVAADDDLSGSIPHNGGVRPAGCLIDKRDTGLTLDDRQKAVGCAEI